MSRKKVPVLIKNSAWKFGWRGFATTVDARTKDTIQLDAAMIMLPAAAVAEDDATAHLSSCNNNEKNGTLLMMSL